MVVGYVASVIAGQVDFGKVADAAWIGLPLFTAPEFSGQYLGVYLMFLPVVLALITENVGHIKGVGQLIRRDLDPLTGRALFADGFATVLSGLGGGSPTTTYGENIGGVTTALYGPIGIIGVRIWVENKVDFSRPVKQLTAGVALIMGIANFTITFGDLSFPGLILGTVAAIVIYHLMSGIAKLRGTDKARLT